jgi:hypothetical protein
MCRERNRDRLTKCVWRRRIFLSFSLLMDKRSAQRQWRTPKWKTLEATISSWNWCRHSIHSTRWTEYLAAKNRQDVEDFTWDGSNSFIQDWRYYEDMTVDSPHGDKWTETDSLDDVFEVASPIQRHLHNNLRNLVTGNES